MEKSNVETRRAGLLRATLVAGGLGVATLLLASCGTSDGGTAETTPYMPKVETEYLANGNRILRYSDDERDYADVTQVCDGGDLFEQTEFLYYGRGNSGVAAGNSIERSVGHPACADGKLTESDFQVAR